MRMIKTLLILLLCSTTPHSSHQASLPEFEAMLERITKDTVDFANYMESLLLTENKCFQDYFGVCERGNYDDCNSEYPYATCSSTDPVILACGTGGEGGCSGFYDHTVSTIRLAPSIKLDMYGEPKEDSVKDAICYTLQAEPYMKGIEKRDIAYWSSYGVSPPHMHYGTDEGVFRIFPGQPKSQCPNTYDPRLRPWYVAGSSGPKSIILVLDTSGTMSFSTRLRTMKDAAERVIRTLGVSDYVSVVEFNSNARAVGGYRVLQRATKEKKEELIRYVENFIASGVTNFERAFEVTFDIFEESKKSEIGLSCNNAILFLTDGEISAGGNATEVYSLINEKMVGFSEEEKPVIFTYSFGGIADESVPQSIACQHDGIWSRIQDGGDLAQSMGAYYKYFAYGLGDSKNEEFVAWVEPYEFASGSGLGTTASVPVYDRTVDPPVLAGVVGIDFPIQAFEKVLGDESAAGRQKVIDRIVELSIASCPALDLSECQRQSLRYYGGEEENVAALCPASTCPKIADLKRISTATCSGVNYPSSFLDNRINEGRTYEERACCSVGEVRVKGTTTYEEIKNSICPKKDGDGDDHPKASGILVPLLCSLGSVLVIVLAVLCWMKKKKKFCFKKRPDPNYNNGGFSNNINNSALERETSAVTEEENESTNVLNGRTGSFRASFLTSNAAGTSLRGSMEEKNGGTLKNLSKIDPIELRR